MLGAHRPRKNLPLAVAAISLLRDRGAAVKLVVTGNIDPLFEGLIADSREFVKCAGVLPKARVFRLLKGAVGLVFPSLYEGFGFPMLEAMAAGCPVLALDTAINREIAGEGAWFLPPEPQAWGQAVARLLGNTSLVTEMREGGFGNLHRFSWDTTAARYAEAFSALGATRQERSPNEAVTAGCP
jgi:glycosyltransferase involved in cell wall biosynthesis